MNRGMTAAAAAWMALCGTGAHAAGTAAQQAKPCLTRAEVQALFVSIAPGVIRSVSTACKAALPKSAYLTNRGESLALRYAEVGAASRPVAIAAIGRIGGEKMEGALNDAMFEVLLDGMLGPMVAAEIKPKDCPLIDRSLELLDPLPPSNMGGVVVLLLEVGLKGKETGGKKAPPFEICEAKG